MIKRAFKFLCIFSALVGSNIHASKDLSDDPIFKKCVQYIQNIQIKPGWLLSYASLALELPEPILHSLHHAGLPLYKPSPEEAFSFLQIVRSQQVSQGNRNLDLGFAPAENEAINQLANHYTRPSNIVALHWRDMKVFPPLLNCLTHLTKLIMYGNKISDLTPLSTLTNLSSLELESNQIVDVAPLSSLTHLTMLLLAHNKIQDVTPLAHLTRLSELLLQDNQIVNVEALGDLEELRFLGLAGNPAVSKMHIRKTFRVFWPTVSITIDDDNCHQGFREK